MRRSIPILLCGSLLVITTIACTLSVAPTNSPDAVATIIAATMAAITPPPTDTPVPPTLSLPTLSPSSVPTLPPVIATVIVPGATRITFLNGATTAIVSAPLSAGQAQSYVLQAGQGQPMLVDVASPNNDVTLSMKTAGGTNMLSASARQTTWKGSLPQTEDYFLTVHGGAATENFTLTVTIASRIKFLPGADSAKITGETVGGYNVTYTAFATKGQKMSVSLGNLSGTAALTIYGFADGSPYANANMSAQTNFSFTLPATQDYIIEVVPQGGKDVRYLLTVKIQ